MTRNKESFKSTPALRQSGRASLTNTPKCSSDNFFSFGLPSRAATLKIETGLFSLDDMLPIVLGSLGTSSGHDVLIDQSHEFSISHPRDVAELYETPATATTLLVTTFSVVMVALQARDPTLVASSISMI